MKLVYTFILVCFINTFSYSQIISGVVRDSISKKNIDAVNFTMINGKQTTIADGLGKYQMMITDTTDKLLVSCVGYQSILIDLNAFLDKKNYVLNLSLIPHIEELKEIIVTTTTKDNFTLKKIGLKKGIVLSWLIPSGNETCTLVKTPYKEEQYVKTVILNIEKRFEKEFFLNHFKINFYEYNESKRQPGAKINTKEIIVLPENKNYALTVDVNSLHIPFPTKGLCIGVEAINTYGIPYDMGPRDISSKAKLINYKNQKIRPAPFLGFAKSNNDPDIQTWERNIDKGKEWGICPAKSTEKYADFNLKINIEVKIKNNEK